MAVWHSGHLLLSYVFFLLCANVHHTPNFQICHIASLILCLFYANFHQSIEIDVDF